MNKFRVAGARVFRIGFLVFFICVSFLVCACGGGSKYTGASISVAQEMSYSRAQYDSSGGSVLRAAMNTSGEELENPQAMGGEYAVLLSRKLVKRAELRLRVEDLGATEKPLTELLEKYNAWTASTGVYENSRSYSIRVPSGFYDAMLAELSGLGRILWHTENAEDVTLHYYDLESRLATKQELLKTYRGYLGRANTVDEIMTVERHIADLQQEIDQTGTQFRNLANLVDYSTINVDISGPVNAVPYSRPSLGEKLAELFGSFGDVASSVLVLLMGMIIYGIPAILILVLLFWLLFGRIGLLKKLWRLAAAKK